MLVSGFAQHVIVIGGASKPVSCRIFERVVLFGLQHVLVIAGGGSCKTCTLTDLFLSMLFGLCSTWL